MPFLCLAVSDREDRASLERNTIALLSEPAELIDRPGPSWLGRHAVPAEIRRSGLWNVDHVGATTTPASSERLHA
jgi:hypothetical protein